MANPTTITTFDRTPGNVFVNLSQPESALNAQRITRYFQDWGAVADQMASDTPADDTAYQMNNPVSDVSEIRIYAENTLTGKRQSLYTGHDTDDTPALCQAYANLTQCRVEWHDAVDAKVFHPDTCPIPTLADWCEVWNADTGELIFAGLRHDGFDTRCRVYADRTSTGLRVDSAHENLSRFYTPRASQRLYGRQNAEHFARKYGVEVS